MASMGGQFCAVTTDDPASRWLGEMPFRVVATGPARSRFGYTPSMVDQLRREIQLADAVVIHGLWQYHGVAARKVCREAGRRYAVFAHGMLDPWFRRRYPLKHLKKQVFWWAEQHAILRDAHAVLFTSEEERRLARGSFWPYTGINERVVAYGARDPGPSSQSHRDAFLDLVPHMGERPYILFLGRLHEKKGPEELVLAYLQMAEPIFDLVLAGPGDPGLIGRIERLLSGHARQRRVHLPGLVQGPAKWGAFFGAQAFILPSHQENFGIAVAEALACGTPVLISDKVNIWREIIGDAAGFAAPDTPAGTADLLDRWSRTSDSDRAAMRIAARKCFLSRFEVDQSSRDYLSLLEELKP